MKISISRNLACLAKIIKLPSCNQTDLCLNLKSSLVFSVCKQSSYYLNKKSYECETFRVILFMLKRSFICYHLHNCILRLYFVYDREIVLYTQVVHFVCFKHRLSSGSHNIFPVTK